MNKFQQADEDDALAEAEMGPTACKAFACFETALKLMEQQPKCDDVQLSIKHIWDLAVHKRVSTSKKLTLLKIIN